MDKGVEYLRRNEELRMSGVCFAAIVLVEIFKALGFASQRQYCLDG